jgi:hypothetical protein
LSEIDIQDLHPHFITKKLTIREVTYKIRGDTILAGRNYDLTLKFESEVPDHLIDKPNFKDFKMFGDFGITINENKEKTLGHSDWGQTVDKAGGNFLD